ncbi:MAG: aldo/keto reductase [Oligoflexia bacterium]|nr:aldo/keto reductase [Oligoflexia bacterium]
MSSEVSAFPGLIYGTAWKEDLTESCTYNAINAGFRAIDTANQRKHYYEEGVGKALVKTYTDLKIKREDLFLQTKFTYIRGQDHRLPYDEQAPLQEQVFQSFESSLHHLHTGYIDSYLLHGPSKHTELTKADWKVWEVMEDLKKQEKVRFIGISNVTLEQLMELYEGAKVKPTFVQNRCYADTAWDQELRHFCHKNQIYYQGFSLLTANWKFIGGEVERPSNRNIPHLIFQEKISTTKVHKSVQAIIEETGKSIQQIIFRFCQQRGMIPITGTRSEFHMKEDLEISDFSLSENQLDIIENIAFKIELEA